MNNDKRITPYPAVLAEDIPTKIKRTVMQVTEAVVFNGKKKVVIEEEEYKVTGYKVAGKLSRIDIDYDPISKAKEEFFDQINMRQSMEKKSQVEEMYGAEPK